MTAIDDPPTAALPCDVVVTDFDLGREATGIECLAQLEKRHGRALPALILTGHDPRKIRSALPDPRMPLLSKPVRSAELQRVIVKLAGGRVSALFPELGASTSSAKPMPGAQCRGCRGASAVNIRVSVVDTIPHRPMHRRLGLAGAMAQCTASL